MNGIPSLPDFVGGIRCDCHSTLWKAVIVRKGKVVYLSTDCKASLYAAICAANQIKASYLSNWSEKGNEANKTAAAAARRSYGGVN